MNKAYFADDIVLNECLREIIVDLESIDFNNPILAANQINADISFATKDKIKDVLKPNDLIQARFLLLNSVYFKADWLNQFATGDTIHKFDFTDDFETKKIGQVSMMTMYQTQFKYSKS